MYRIYKDGQCIENGIQNLKLDYLKKRLKSVGGDTLHVVTGDVTSVYQNRNGRVVYSHTHTRRD